MAKVLIAPVRPGRVKRDHSPRITITRDGSARISRSAHVALGAPDHVAVYHDSDDKNLIYVSRNGDRQHKLSKYLAFGASQLHKYAGSPDHPVHVPLEFDADGDLKGDLRQAVHGENRPWTAARRANLNVSGVTAATAAPTHRSNGRTVEASSTGLRDEMQPPVASAPPDFSYDEEYDPAY